MERARMVPFGQEISISHLVCLKTNRGKHYITSFSSNSAQNLLLVMNAFAGDRLRLSWRNSWHDLWRYTSGGGLSTDLRCWLEGAQWPEGRRTRGNVLPTCLVQVSKVCCPECGNLLNNKGRTQHVSIFLVHKSLSILLKKYGLMGWIFSLTGFLKLWRDPRKIP